VNDYGLEDNIL